MGSLWDYLSSVSGPDRGFFSKLNGTGPLGSRFKLSPVIRIPVSVMDNFVPNKSDSSPMRDMAYHLITDQVGRGK